MAAPRGRSSAGEQDRLAELASLYEEASWLYAHHRCAGSTECCRFGLRGREPYVTSIELHAIERALARRGGLPPARYRALPLDPHRSDEGICPLLARDGRCVVYAQRPLGCRSYWCDRATSYGGVGHREVQKLVRRVQAIAARHVPGGDAGRPLRRALAHAAR